MERLLSQLVTMIFLTHALESQSNNSAIPQDGKRNTLFWAWMSTIKCSGFVQKRYSGSTHESRVTYFAYCVQFFQQQKAFTSMRFLKSGKIIVYSVRTEIYCNTNLYLTNCERARRVNSGPSRHFVTFKPRKSNFFRLQTKSLARHGARQQDYDCIVIAVMYIRHASFLSFLLLQVPLIS